MYVMWLFRTNRRENIPAKVSLSVYKVVASTSRHCEKWVVVNCGWKILLAGKNMGAYTKWDYLHNKLPHPQHVYSCVTQFPCLNRKWDEIQTPDSRHRPARSVQCQSQTYRKYIYPFLVDQIRYSQEKACKSAFMYGQKLQKWRKYGTRSYIS